jgi:hypothetical protein
MGLGPKRPKKWIRQAAVLECIEVAGFNHPFYIENDDYIEYQGASSAWWKIEPQFRDNERMRSSRGDYGKPDNWEVAPNYDGDPV